QRPHHRHSRLPGHAGAAEAAGLVPRVPSPARPRCGAPGDSGGGGMTRSDEYAFLAAFASAMRHSESEHALDVLWREYSEQISALSREGQDELRRLRTERGRELMQAKKEPDHG